MRPENEISTLGVWAACHLAGSDVLADGPRATSRAKETERRADGMESAARGVTEADMAEAITWTTAREKFKIGDRVVLTQEAKDNGLFIRSKGEMVLGTVVGFSKKSEYLVYVKADHRKANGTTYHVKFWQVL
jgi:hypothetical protein